MLYLINGFVLKAIGPGIATSKLAGVLSAIASLAILALALYRISRPTPEWRWWTALTALLLMTFGAAAFWTRAEPLLVLCSTLSLLGLTLPAPASFIVVGLALGIDVNVKVTAAIYLLPSLLLLWQRQRGGAHVNPGGPGQLVGAIAVAGAVAALPFALSDSISLSGYWYWIETAISHGIRPQAFPTLLQWAFFILLPLAVFSARTDAAWMFRTVLIGTVLASVVVAAKHGSGPYHFVPFVPSVVFCAALTCDATADTRRGSIAAAWLLTSGLLAAVQLQQWVTLTTSLPSREIVSEMRGFEARFEGPMAVGYSLNYRTSFYRPLLVFDGHPQLLDAVGLMDRHWTNAPFPQEALDSLATCRVRTWLIPRGGEPFVLPTAYPRGGSVVPEEFRQAFQSRYEVVDRGGWFDVWRCR
jgi:hypothetical protein